MHKTVFTIIVSLTFITVAQAQAKVDSMQNKAMQATFLKDTSRPNPFFMQALVPSNFYTTHLPFFCDKELKLQKAVKMSVKFRLGSVEAADRLEGKH